MKRLAAQRAIAADTGGEAILNTNNFSGAFESLVRSNSTYYLLGYRPAQDHRDGRFHTITIRVRRPGLSVRARKGYLAPEPGPTVEARVLPGVSPAGGAALVNPFPTTGLEISVFLSPFKGAARDASVVLGADLRGLVRDGAEGRLEVSFLAIDAQGAMRVGSPKNLALSDLGSQSAGPARYIDRLALPPGRHEVRIAMHQPGGETGSVTTYVEVPDFTQGPLGMSGLVLASAGTAAQPTLLADATLKDRLSSDPTVRRRFARSDSITAFGEVYVDERTRPEDVRVTATIATAGQKSVRSVTPAVAANEPGRVGHTTRLALAGLTPGDYVLTLEAQVGRRRAMRQVPFSVLSD
jgi:hypothetical protein